jgi:hypothetical protein
VDVNVTGWPEIPGFGLAVSVVWVLAWFTVWVTGLLTLDSNVLPFGSVNAS